MKQKLALIGSGKIAPFHIAAAIKAGFKVNAIASSNKSNSALKLSKEYEIPFYFESVTELIESKKYNSFAILTPPVETIQILHQVYALEVPILTEKPVSLQSKKLNGFVKEKHIFVAYNRRFYDTIAELKKVEARQGGIFNFEIIESNDKKFKLSDSVESAILENSVHILDLIHYILGAYSLREFIYSPITNNIQSRIYVKNIFKGNLSISFDAIKNTRIDHQSKNLNITLSPLEKMNKYNAMKIIEPDFDTAIRRYIPSWSGDSNQGELSENSRFKPGFLKQYLEFYNYCNAKIKPATLANIADARYALDKGELIVKQFKKLTN